MLAAVFGPGSAIGLSVSTIKAEGATMNSELSLAIVIASTITLLVIAAVLGG